MNLQKNCLRFLALSFALIATRASAQVVVASQAGQYTAAGDYTSGNTNYATGAFEGEFRSFFVFNLPVFSGPIVSAQLEIFNFGGSDDIPAGFYSEDGAETLTLFQVSTALSTLVSGGSGLTDIFSDLGSGASFGSTAITEASNGQYVSLFLNGTFLADLNAASGSSIALGGALTSLSDPNGFEFVFGNSDLSSAAPSVRLTLMAAAPPSAVPEPSTYAFGAVGLLAVVILRRRINRRNA